MPTVEVKQLDLSYEGCRLRDGELERRILASLVERGQEEPIEGVRLGEDRVLVLNGFKRIRAASKLGIAQLEYAILGEDAPSGIIGLLRTSQKRSLHILEQSRWISELRKTHQLPVTEIARLLDRSPAWVSVRLGLDQEMSPQIREAVFTGKFPVRAYLYSLRHFTRVKQVAPAEAEKFVQAVSGKGLSGRNVEQLAKGYFQGGEAIRSQIEQGNLAWCLEKLNQGVSARETPEERSDLSEGERKILRDLRFSQDLMERLTRLRSPEKGEAGAQDCVFYAEAELLSAGVLRRLEPFGVAIRRLYDRCREKKIHLGPIPAGPRQEAHRETARAGS